MKAEKCVICGSVIQGFGNNPRPLVNHGWCCDECNKMVTQWRYMNRH